MTETIRVVPEGKNAIENLTVGELDTASRALGADVVEAAGGGARRWAAFAWIAFLWAKRADPKAKLDTYLNMQTDELLEALGMDDDEDDQAAENPTTPAPA